MHWARAGLEAGDQFLLSTKAQERSGILSTWWQGVKKEDRHETLRKLTGCLGRAQHA